MDIKKINEELSKMLEDGGFALSGTASEVTDLINKLAQEYGDLTIPEFIDVLINKEKQGEDVLQENYEYDDLRKVVKLAKITNNLDNVPAYGYNSYGGYTILNTPKNIIDVCKFYGDIRGPKDEDMRVTLELTSFRGNLSDDDISAIYSHKTDIESNFIINNFDYVKFGRSNTRVCIDLILYDYKENYKEGAKQLRDMVYMIEDIIYNARQERLEKERQEKQARDDAYYALKKARLQALKTAKNTTVKQALSKSSVAKKIQSLQNPTPEQLAKILAAIEG